MHETPSGQTCQQLDPSENSDYVDYALVFKYTNSGIVKSMTSAAISVNVASSTYGYAAGVEYWNADTWAFFDDPKNTAVSLSFTGTKAMWSTTPKNPLGSTIVNCGKSSVAWVKQGQSLPAGTWLYASTVGTIPPAAVSLVNTKGVLSVAWGILSVNQPATGTYVVTLATRVFDTTVPTVGTAQWWIPG